MTNLVLFWVSKSHFNPLLVNCPSRANETHIRLPTHISTFIHFCLYLAKIMQHEHNSQDLGVGPSY